MSLLILDVPCQPAVGLRLALIAQARPSTRLGVGALAQDRRRPASRSAGRYASTASR